MTAAAAFLGAWGVLPTTVERRNIMHASVSLADHDPTADAAFDEGWALDCTATSSGPATFEPVALDAVTLADGDALHVMIQIKLIAWSHLDANPPTLVILNTARHSNNITRALYLAALDSDTGFYLRLRDGTGSTVLDTGKAMSYATHTVYTLLMSVERLTSTTGKIVLRQWDGSTWAEVDSASGTVDWSSLGAFTSVTAGASFTAGKGDVGAIRVSRVVVSINVIPSGAMLCDHEVLPDAEGATYDEWTPSTGSDNYAMVDDAMGSESDADYMDSSSTTSQKTQEVGFAAVSGVTDTIRGVVISAGVVQTPATCNGTAYMATRLSGTDSAFADAYYGDSAWDTAATSVVEKEDTHRFFAADPSGAAWTQTNINSATYLFRKVATGAAENWRIGSLVLQVLHGDVWTPPAASGDRRRLLAQVI